MNDHDLLADEKKFYDRFYALHNDPQLLDVFKRYGIAAFRRSSVLEGFEQFIVANKFSGKRCLEIGTLKGLTACVLARHFEYVYSFDIINDPQKYEIADFLGVKNVCFINVRDNADKNERISGTEFDAAFMDGNHHDDTHNDISHVKRCGRVLFHEYWPSQPAVVDVVDHLRLYGTVTTAGKFALWDATRG